MISLHALKWHQLCNFKVIRRQVIAGGLKLFDDRISIEVIGLLKHSE